MSVGYCYQTIRQHDGLVFKGGDVQWTDHEIWDYHVTSKHQAPTTHWCGAISQKTTALLSTPKHLHTVHHHQDPSEMLLQLLTTYSATDFSIASLWVCNTLLNIQPYRRKALCDRPDHMSIPVTTVSVLHNLKPHLANSTTSLCL